MRRQHSSGDRAVRYVELVGPCEHGPVEDEGQRLADVVWGFVCGVVAATIVAFAALALGR